MLLHSKTYANTLRIPEDYGCRHLRFKFQNDPVDVVIMAKKGEQKIPKPLLFFCQEPQPKPLICYDGKGLHPIFPFDENPLLEHFHLAIAAPPFVAVIADISLPGKQLTFCGDSDKMMPPKGFAQRNHLDYYVFRNNFLLRQFSKERWVKSRKMVVAGFGEGSAIAVRMAASNPKITELICKDFNPYGKVAGFLAASRFSQACASDAAAIVADWKMTVQHSQAKMGERAAYDFSLGQHSNLLQLKIPVLMACQNHGQNAFFNDLLKIEAIREAKTHLHFKTETADGQVADFGQTGKNWLQWLSLLP